jgi:hypothetical protein
MVVPTLTQAQEYKKALTFGVDPKLMIDGAYEDSQRPSMHYYASLIFPENETWEFGLKVNYTEALEAPYFNWGGFANIKWLQLNQFRGELFYEHTVYSGVEVTMLMRPKLYYSVGINTGYRFQMTEHWGLFVEMNLMTRPELSDRLFTGNLTNENADKVKLNGQIGMIYYFDLYK